MSVDEDSRRLSASCSATVLTATLYSGFADVVPRIVALTPSGLDGIDVRPRVVPV